MTLIPPATNVGVGVDLETTGLSAKVHVCDMGLDTRFIKLLGVSDVGDLRM